MSRENNIEPTGYRMRPTLLVGAVAAGIGFPLLGGALLYSTVTGSTPGLDEFSAIPSAVVEVKEEPQYALQGIDQHAQTAQLATVQFRGTLEGHLGETPLTLQQKKAKARDALPLGFMGFGPFMGLVMLGLAYGTGRDEVIPPQLDASDTF